MQAIFGATEKSLQNSVRKRSDYEFGERAADCLTDFLPILSEGERATAAATCRIQIMGKQSHIHNGESQRRGWDSWAHVRMNSQGICPTSEFVALKCLWVKADRHSAVDAVLACFGLSIDNLFDHYGKPADDQRLILDLSEIVLTLAPELLTETAAAIAS